MAKIPRWKQAIIKVKARKQMKKMYEGMEAQLEEIKGKIGDLIDQMPDSDQMNALIIICAETIAGFDEKEHQNFIIDMVKETLNNLKE